VGDAELAGIAAVWATATEAMSKGANAKKTRVIIGQLASYEDEAVGFRRE
jgi:hypothetical protein